MARTECGGARVRLSITSAPGLPPTQHLLALCDADPVLGYAVMRSLLNTVGQRLIGNPDHGGEQMIEMY